MDVVGIKLPDRKQAGNTCKLKSSNRVFSNPLQFIALFPKSTCLLQL